MNRLFETDIKPFPAYFYLDWEHRTAEWRTADNVPSKRAFTTTVKWLDMKKVSIEICTNSGSSSESDGFMLDSIYNNVSYLKSHLQKAIRLSDVYRTIKTAYHMLDLDLLAFLRRLAIIALEDSLPLEGFSVIVWFTAAVSKGYVMSDSQKAWCVGYATTLAQSKLRDHPAKCEEDFLLAKKKIPKNNSESDLLYSIYFRKSYGGLRGDKAMLVNYTKLWYDRFMSNFGTDVLRNHVYFVTPPTAPLELNEWLLSAVDFHCCPNIIHMLHDNYDQYEESEIKRAIWIFSSSVTNKKYLTDNSDTNVINDELFTVWKTISKKFRNLSRYMLSKNH